MHIIIFVSYTFIRLCTSRGVYIYILHTFNILETFIPASLMWTDVAWILQIYIQVPSSMFPLRTFELCHRTLPLRTTGVCWLRCYPRCWSYSAFAMFSKVTLLEASNDVGGHAKTWVDKDRGVLGGYPTGCWMSYRWCEAFRFKLVRASLSVMYLLIL